MAMNYDLEQAYRAQAFAMVSDKTNWKNMIRAEIKLQHSAERQAHEVEQLQAILTDAIVHFTGSIPTFAVVNGALQVSAAGYYVAIGA